MAAGDAGSQAPSSVADTEATAMERRFGLAVCHASMMTLSISLNLMPVCLPILSHGAGQGVALTNEQLGRIAATAFVGTVAGLLLAGPAANRFQAKWFTVGGNLLIAAGLAALRLAGSYGAILAAVALLGLGGGVLDMILSPIVCALEPGRRSQAMNWLHSFYCIGAVLTVLGATVAFAMSCGWREVALWMAVPPAAVAAAFLFVRHPVLVSGEVQRTGIRALLRERFFLLTLAMIFLAGVTEMGIAQWLPAFAELELGMSRWAGGILLLAFSVSMALGRMSVGAISGWIPIRRLMAWSGGTTALLLLTAGTCPSAPVSLAAAVASGLTLSCLWPSTLGVVADRFPMAKASMFGVLSAVGNLGGILMPWAIGIIADSSSIALGIAASAAAPALMLLVLRGMGRGTGVPAPGAVA
jgi:fucose permease